MATFLLALLVIVPAILYSSLLYFAGTIKRNEAIVDVISYTCAFPAMTYEVSKLKKGLLSAYPPVTTCSMLLV